MILLGAIISSRIGIQNAMILKRVLKFIRQYFPGTHILVRGDSRSVFEKIMTSN